MSKFFHILLLAKIFGYYTTNMTGNWQVELENARRARMNGNEGRARVCARRAAGMAARDFLTRHGGQQRTVSAYDALLTLEQFPGLAPDLQTAASHLTLRVSEEFILPVEVDLIAEAQKLIDRLENHG
jgi:hypothetical protein